MPILVNNVRLGECAAVIVNGTPAAEVRVNNNVVYDEVCFSGIWSGNTVADNGITCFICDGTLLYGQSNELHTSGTTYRYESMIPGAGCVAYNRVIGPWLTSGPTGMETGTSYVTDSFGDWFGVSTTTYGFNLTAESPYMPYEGIMLSFTTGFSGTAGWQKMFYDHTGSVHFETSGGQMRAVAWYDGSCYSRYEALGAWITCT